MPEPEAELQATADLSPVSPSPLHTAAPLVVPALQDTVDTIDAMVAAVAASNGTAEELPMPTEQPTAEEAEDVVDDESFSDAYGEDAAEVPVPIETEQQQLPDSNDDYAKTFDSPINHEEEIDGGDDAQQEDVSSMPQESNEVALSSNHLSSGPTGASSDVVPEQSQTGPSEEDATVNPANAQSNLTAPSQPIESQLDPATAAPANESAKTAAVQKISPEAEGQQPVADTAAQPSEPTSNPDASDSVAPPEASGRSSTLPSALPASSSLPPRPPQPQANVQSNVAQHHPAGATPTLVAQHATASAPGSVHNFVAPGAPGTSTEAFSSLPPPPTVGAQAAAALNSMNVPSYSVSAPGYGADHSQGNSYESQWDQFMSDERQYMSEAKWDRFPEGSRIFIGNLSSDKVSKREVFEIFHPFGRLAQISLKSAYGFVQYHTAEEGNRAMANLQGMEVKGRRIHLEVSRVQDKSKRDRGRSPDRGKGPDNRRADRFSQQRDDYRPSRNRSPRRGDSYGGDDGYSRDGRQDSGRRGSRRSRSPPYGRGSKDSYRRRSPSPYGRSRSEPELDLPRRYGPEVPDVQVILQPDVSRDFVSWVEGHFKAKGLKTEVMYLHPRIPKDQVIQRQAAEGVHAVVELDLRAQHLGKVPVQAFDRTAGSNNVRFDQYVDLDPSTAGEVILRAKASGAPPSYNPGYGGQGGYPSQYGSQPQSHPQMPQYPPAQQYQQHQPQPSYPAQHQAPPPAQLGGLDLSSLVGKLDNNTLQQLLATIDGPGAAGAPPAGHRPHGSQGGPPAGNPSVDIQALLSSLGTGGAAPPQGAHAPQGQYGAPYGAPSAPQGPPPGANGDSAAQVQNIMAQLARFRQ